MLNTPLSPINTHQAVLNHLADSQSLEWLWVPFEEQGASSAQTLMYGNVGGADSDGIQLALAGTTSATWNNPPMATLPSGGNQMPVTDSSIDSFLAWDNLVNGGLLIMLDYMFFTNNPTTTETLLSSNVTGNPAPHGGWRLDHSTTGIKFRFKEAGSGTLTTAIDVATTVANSWHNGRIGICIYIDGANQQILGFFRKGGVTDLTTSYDISGLTLPTVGDDGLGIACRIEADGSGSTAEWMGVNGDNPRIGNLFMLKTTQDVSAYIPEVFEEYWYARHRLPSIIARQDWG